MKINAIILTIILAIAGLSCSNKSDKARSMDNQNGQDTTLKKTLAVVSQVAGIGLIEPEDLVVDLSTQVGGTITNIYNNISDAVEKGDIIIQLDDRDEQLALQKLMSEKAIQQQQIVIAEAQIEDTKAQLNNIQATRDDSKILVQKGGETKQNLDNLQTNVASLLAELKQRSASLELQQITLDGINVDIAQAKRNIEKKKLIAPSDGLILQIAVAIYSNIDPNETMVTFAPKGPVIARCEIDEMFASKVKIGQKATIRNIGFSDVIATGKVVLAAPFLSQKSLLSESSTDQQDRRVREVRILIDDPKNLLFNGRVECTIQTN